MKIYSNLPTNIYMSKLKASMDSHWEFFAEHCTGFFLGRLICVTYHSGYEWNRRITNQKNTALGFVRSHGESTTVHYILLKGLLAPQYLLLILALCAGIVFIISHQQGFTEEMYSTLIPAILFTAVFSVGIEAVSETLTDESQEGAERLEQILTAPVDRNDYS